MTEDQYVQGRKPEGEIPAGKIGKLESPREGDANSPAASQDEAGGRTSPFWVKCWSCHKFLTRPLAPPSQQAFTCPNCGAVNMI
jgi:hypothetical protein